MTNTRLIEPLSQRRPLRDFIDRARTSLWKQVQWPDPERLYQTSSLFVVAAFLRQCWSPELTKQILARHGAQIHPEAWPVGPNVTLHEFADGFHNLSIGAHAHVGREVFLDLTDRVVIEDSVSVGMRAVILTHLNVGEYPGKPIAKLIPKKQQPTILRRGCSVGAGSIVLCGVEIGEHAVIGAGVVVDRDVPPRTVVTSSRHKPDYEIPEALLRKAERALARGH
jgi:acetyltransferase-like isoleucine patch superfamily enzyme